MISRLNAPSPKLFLSPGLQETPSTTRQARFVYFKPFLLATAITVLLSFFISVAFITLANCLPAAIKAPGIKWNPPPVKNTTWLLQDSTVHEDEWEALINNVKQKCPANLNATETLLTVRLSDDLMYRLHCSSTLQEAATPDEKLLWQIARQLDAQGAEYAIFKNAGDSVLLCKNEWIVSWGGILYLPQATELSSLTAALVL